MIPMMRSRNNQASSTSRALKTRSSQIVSQAKYLIVFVINVRDRIGQYDTATVFWTDSAALDDLSDGGHAGVRRISHLL